MEVTTDSSTVPACIAFQPQPLTPHMTQNSDSEIDPDTLAELERAAIKARYSAEKGTGPPRAPRRYDFTALSTAKQCPRRYVLEHAVGLPPDVGVSAGAETDAESEAPLIPDELPQSVRVGTLFHTVVEQCWPADRPRSEWKRYAAALATARDWDDCNARVEALIDAFLDSPVADWDITAARVEPRFEFDVDGRTITGAIDAIPVRDNGQAVVLDYKTGESNPAEEQLLIYLLAAYRDDDLDLPASPADAAFLKAHGDQFEIEPLTIRDKDAALEKAAEVAQEWIELADTASYADPAPGDQCSRCPYQSMCDAASEP